MTRPHLVSDGSSSEAPHESAISPIEDIIEDARNGRPYILVDAEDRENEGDVIIPAQFATPDQINFMAKHARGLICLSITGERARALRLPPMAVDNQSGHGTAFTVSIEAREGVTTGISAHDRAHTIAVAVDPTKGADVIVSPGHVFPLVAKDGGVLVRAGHTEAGCDLAQMAGFEPASVICEVLKDDGSMARLPDLIEFGRAHGLKIGTIADLIHHRSRNEKLVERTFSRQVTLAQGEFTLHAYTDQTSDDVHLALTKGRIDPEQETLVRVHEPLSVLDFLDPASTNHTFSLDQAQRALSNAPSGVIVLLRRPESAEDLLGMLARQSSEPRPAAKWDPRIYGIGAQILRDLGVRKMKLLASPRRMPSMTGFDLEVTGYVSSPDELA